MWLFCAGFVLAGSGWGPALSRLLSRGPAWSVCGQALCDCRPIEAEPSQMPDDCPLCLAGIAMPEGSTCSTNPDKIDATRLLIRRTKSASAMTRLDSAAQAFQVGCFLVGLPRHTDCDGARAATALALDRWSLPTSRSGDVPTPPPRS